MTRVLLCAGPTLLVIDKDGVLFYRRPRQPDVQVPYAPRNYSAFFHSARYKYDMSPVIGTDGEQNPLLPEGTTIPELQSECLSTGETVFRIVAEIPLPIDKGQNVPATPGVA
jgi:hypothetical protein